MATRNRDAWIFPVCVLVCAAIWALTPTPEFGPVHPDAVSSPASRVALTGPNTPVAAAGKTDGPPEPAGRRGDTARALAILFAVGVLFCLIANDLLSIDDRKPGRRPEAVTPNQERDRSAC